MSQTLVCLTEPFIFHAQDVKQTEIADTSADSKTFKSDVIDTMHIFHSMKHDNQNKDSSFKGTIDKQIASRKREATSVLMECVKRRDNSRTHDFEINVPLSQSHQGTPFRTSDYCNYSIQCNDTIAESIGLMDTSNSDLSDSASASDSGIDTLSKSSSPCHSIDAESCQEDTGAESPAASIKNIDVEDDLLPELAQPHSENQNSEQSSTAIYEDLNCLHLTEETVLSQEKDVKSPISKSLFNNVASTIYFSLKDEKVAPMPDHVLPFMKWKLSTITPVLIKELVQKCGFILLDANTTEEWLGTWGKHLKCASFKRIKGYQKVNHYPGSFHLGRKDKLWDNYKRMQGRFGNDAYNFFPETFHLPSDMNLLKNVWQTDEEKCWIIKPPASARGTGVKVIYKWSQVPKNRPVIVQRYLTDPYLINGTKFDLRIYVLVSSIEPLKVYVFEDGLVRFASEKYSLSNKSLSNRFVHLTNYSINRKSSSYTSNEDENSCQGHKWTLKSFWTYMTNSGINVEGIQEAITDMIIKTVICAEGPICRLMKTYARSTYNCYELFGFDIMLDKNLRPWLLEVNISPSLHTRSLLDYTVKGQMVKDMMNMAGFQVPEKRSSSPSTASYGILSPAATKHKSLRNRCLSPKEKEKHSLYTFHYEKFDILNQLTPDDVRCLIESEDEYHRKGAFTRIFPSTTSSKYFVYFEHIRYYNMLLDAWEKTYHTRREEGIRHLQELCDKNAHLQTCIKEPSNTVQEPEIEITGMQDNSSILTCVSQQ